MVHRISFEFDEGEATSQALVPVVDGRRLDVIVEEYERDRAFDVIGGYAGLVVRRLKVDDLMQYLAGMREPWPGRRVPLLGCECGDLGCWPLVASVEQDDAVIRWSEFEQPHRPGRDYSSLGPFVFDRAAYVAAVQAVSRRGSTVSGTRSAAPTPRERAGLR